MWHYCPYNVHFGYQNLKIALQATLSELPITATQTHSVTYTVLS